MTRRLLLSLFLVFSMAVGSVLHAQETGTPSLPPLTGGFSQPSNTQNFDGFLLDTSTLGIAPVSVTERYTSGRSLIVPPMESLLERMHINNGVVYSNGNIPMISTQALTPYQFTLSSNQMQSASYHLKSGGVLSLFGEYDANGNRRSYVVNPLNRRSQNSFTGGFQYKAPGSSGFSVHVQVHRGTGYPY